VTKNHQKSKKETEDTILKKLFLRVLMRICVSVFSKKITALGGQLACAAMYYRVFSAIVNITKGGCGCCFGKEKGPRKD
jgi:hypothetical protein